MRPLSVDRSETRARRDLLRVDLGVHRRWRRLGEHRGRVRLDGVETCGPEGVCEPGTAPCVGADGDDNCAESCDETTDTCSANDPFGSACIQPPPLRVRSPIPLVLPPNPLREHQEQTYQLARSLKGRDVYLWLIRHGYFPESYVLPPCF